MRTCLPSAWPKPPCCRHGIVPKVTTSVRFLKSPPARKEASLRPNDEGTVIAVFDKLRESDSNEWALYED